MEGPYYGDMGGARWPERFFEVQGIDEHAPVKPMRDRWRIRWRFQGEEFFSADQHIADNPNKAPGDMLRAIVERQLKWYMRWYDIAYNKRWRRYKHTLEGRQEMALETVTMKQAMFGQLVRHAINLGVPRNHIQPCTDVGLFKSTERTLDKRGLPRYEPNPPPIKDDETWGDWWRSQEAQPLQGLPRAEPLSAQHQRDRTYPQPASKRRHTSGTAERVHSADDGVQLHRQEPVPQHSLPVSLWSPPESHEGEAEPEGRWPFRVATEDRYDDNDDQRVEPQPVPAQLDRPERDGGVVRVDDGSDDEIYQGPINITDATKKMDSACLEHMVCGQDDYGDWPADPKWTVRKRKRPDPDWFRITDERVRPIQREAALELIKQLDGLLPITDDFRRRFGLLGPFPIYIFVDIEGDSKKLQRLLSAGVLAATKNECNQAMVLHRQTYPRPDADYFFERDRVGSHLTHTLCQKDLDRLGKAFGSTEDNDFCLRQDFVRLCMQGYENTGESHVWVDSAGDAHGIRQIIGIDLAQALEHWFGLKWHIIVSPEDGFLTWAQRLGRRWWAYNILCKWLQLVSECPFGRGYQDPNRQNSNEGSLEFWIGDPKKPENKVREFAKGSYGPHQAGADCGTYWLEFCCRWPEEFGSIQQILTTESQKLYLLHQQEEDKWDWQYIQQVMNMWRIPGHILWENAVKASRGRVVTYSNRYDAQCRSAFRVNDLHPTRLGHVPVGMRAEKPRYAQRSKNQRRVGRLSRRQGREDAEREAQGLSKQNFVFRRF